MIDLAKENKMKMSIAASFMDIASRKQFEKISISEIMAPLNVSRQNFYYYFQDVNDLIEWLADFNFASVIAEFIDDKDHVRQCSDSWKHIFEYRNFYRNMLGFSGKGIFEKSFYEVMRLDMERHIGRKRMTEEMRFSCDLYIKGIIGILIDLLNTDKEVDSEKIGMLVHEALPYNIKKFYE